MEPWREELYHHGIKGMHWGIRRFQNPDGSLTSAGRNRYGVSRRQFNKEYNEVYKKRYRENMEKNGGANLERQTKYLDRQISNLSPKMAHEYTKDWYHETDRLKGEAYEEAKKYTDDVLLKKYGQETFDEMKRRNTRDIKIGLAVAGTALAAYGAYKIATSPGGKAVIRGIQDSYDVYRKGKGKEPVNYVKAAQRSQESSAYNLAKERAKLINDTRKNIKDSKKLNPSFSQSDFNKLMSNSQAFSKAANQSMKTANVSVNTDADLVKEMLKKNAKKLNMHGTYKY